MGIFGSLLGGRMTDPQDMGVMPGDQPVYGKIDPMADLLGKVPDSPQIKQGRDWVGTLSNIAGIVGDSLLTANGRQGFYVPMMMQQRQRQQELALAEKQRQQALQDKITLEQYKMAHPDPTETQRTYEWLKTMDPALAEQFIKNRANPMQGVRVTNPDGSEGIQFVRPGGAQGAQSGPQVGAVEDGYRFKGGDPADPNSWEQVGGPTQPASGGFR